MRRFPVKRKIIFRKTRDSYERTEIITNDGRVEVGILLGLDQVVNVVLANTEERVFTSEGIDKQQLGLYLIRGDNVAIVGKIIIY